MVSSNLMDMIELLMTFLLGAGIGVAIGRTHSAREQARSAREFRALSAEALAANNAQFLDLAEARLREAGAANGGDLEARRGAVAALVGPLGDTLDRVEARLRELELARTGAYSALTEQVTMARAAAEQLTTRTTELVTALRAPQARGRWGELQLRRVVELAGMAERCDFDEQVSAATADGALRPDLVVRLTAGRTIVVDAKVSLAAYLEATEATDEARREERLRAHARHLRTHVDQLAAKEYWRAVAGSPEFVVLFIPGEAFLAPALDRDPALLEHAMAARVVIATPTTLVAMLRTIAWSWQQDALTAHAREVFDLGRELYARLATMGDHVDRLGRSLNRAVGDYNAAAGSLESRVLVTARRLHELRVVGDELPAPRSVDACARPLTATELVLPGT